jgi:hypothetical protein
MTPSGETMKTGASRFFRRSTVLAAVGILALVLTACTGRGGGQLPPSAGFTGPASFGFSFSCEDKGGLNARTGQLHIQLSYSDKGSNPLGSSFGIHGTVDSLQPVVESAVCNGLNEPPVPRPPNELIFLGRYRLTSGSPSSLSDCPTTTTATSPSCRFEVEVHDNDGNAAPSEGDFFSITLSNVPVSCDGSTFEDVFPCSQLSEEAPTVYTRKGTLRSGNLTVD